MHFIRKFSGLRFMICVWLSILAAFSLAGRCVAQSTSSLQSGIKHRSASATPAKDDTIPALLISDIHFDPFHDPAKLQQLVSAQVSDWGSILAAQPSPNQQQAFDSLQEQCNSKGSKGVDTPYALLHSGILAMHSDQPDAKFMTVSGDLIAHAFPCRYKTLLPASTQSDYQTFVLKTLSFVVTEIRATFPNMPIYAALGNNDTGCGDYHLDAGSEFLMQAGSILAEGLPLSARQSAVKQFAEGGYYSVSMAAPMQDTRLVVINDLFLSPKYLTCNKVPNATAANTEITWLKDQLAEARQSGQKVWVMGHIPPGVDPYSTVARMKNLCDATSAVMFLSSSALADVLIENADVLRLGIFAHTHMDELRLLELQDGAAQASVEHSVAIKMVPSISPVDGNNPSFTIARVNPSTAVLKDFEVIAASNQSGIATTWNREYKYAGTYHEAEFSPIAVKELIAQFKNDRESKEDTSAAYIRNYFVGDRSSELKPFWPEYVCALANSTAKAFAACACSAAK